MASVWRGCSEPAAGVPGRFGLRAAGAPGRFGLRAAGDPGCELAAAGKRGSGWAGKCSNGAGRGYNVSAWASGIQGRGVTEEVGTPGRGLTMGGGILRRGAREGGGTPRSIGRDRLEGGWILGMGLMEAVGTPEREIMEGDGILERWTSEGGRVSPRCQTMGYVGTGATWCLVLGRFGVGRSNLSPVFLKPACSQITNIIGQGPLKVVGLEFLPRCTWALGTTIAPMREAQFGSSARRSWPHLWAKPTHGHLQLHPWARAVSTDVPQDVLLFQHHRPIYFRLLGLFCGAQSLFWAYLAFIAFTSLKDTGCKETVLIGDQAQGLPKIRGMALNLGADKWRYGFTASCLTMGFLIFAAGVVFARRSVCGVLLHQGGKEVTISSHGLLGGTRSFRTPLRHLSCLAHRGQVASFIPLRVRGHRLYYLLDRRGQFLNTRLFDVTVGAFRNL